MLSTSGATPIRSVYGADPDNQFGDLYVPPGQGPFPVVAVIHGGWWKHNQTLDSYPTRHIVSFILSLGTHAVWNLEFRRMEAQGANIAAPWPAVLADVADGIDHLRVLAEVHRLDLASLTILGHSAGAHLAAWAACRKAIAPDGVLFRPKALHPACVGLLAGIFDISDAASLEQPGQVVRFLGGKPANLPGRRAMSCPATLGLNPEVRGILVHGDRDTAVRPEQSRAFQRQFPDQLALEICYGGHFAMLPNGDDPAPYWADLQTRIAALLTA